MRILIAEDEGDMLRIIRLYLEKEGYEVDEALDGRKAFEMLCEGAYDLLITDWMMPNLSGIDLCREVRAYGLDVKIIMLTAKDDVKSEIEGLSFGADDYVRKPFEPRLLLLRIQKMFGIENGLCCGSLRLDARLKRAFLGQEEVLLTNKELLLLEMFLLNKGRILSRDLLLDRVWGREYDGDERTLDTHVRRLRNKIGREFITTYVGVGYKMGDLK